MSRLGEALRGYRAIQVPSIGLRAAADEIGVSPTTLFRVENGHVPDYDTLMRIWGWLTMPEPAPGAVTDPSLPSDGREGGAG